VLGLYLKLDEKYECWVFMVVEMNIVFWASSSCIDWQEHTACVIVVTTLVKVDAEVMF
jgi:hypothetical protein